MMSRPLLVLFSTVSEKVLLRPEAGLRQVSRIRSKDHSVKIFPAGVGPVFLYVRKALAKERTEAHDLN
jgi:hypothetical protein